MKRIIISCVFVYVLFTATAGAAELTGHISVEGRLFTHDALYPHQEHSNASIAVEPELYHEWSDGSSLTFAPFVRVDSVDEERTHVDIRELSYISFTDSWELQIGIGKVFWGVTESQHLVDIINQTDLVEDIDGEEKLGQPMVHLSLLGDQGTLEVFALPYFRERTFAGREGRLRGPDVVDTGQAVYESSAGERHVDAAERYTRTIGDWETGLSHFHGTFREPAFIAGTGFDGESVLIPRYEVIDQTGLELHLVAGQWLWKLESIYRSGLDSGDFAASTVGFEYTFTGVSSRGMDVGLLAEWLYDDRGAGAAANDNDVMLGARLAVNDQASTEALCGIIQDIHRRGTVFSVEGSRRISRRWKLKLQGIFNCDTSAEDAAYPLRDDDHLRLELSYYF